jgi:glutamate synthase (NADPH/NADH) small chain
MQATSPLPQVETDQAGGGVRVWVDEGRCAGCQECVVRCPAGALSVNPTTWQAVATADLCVGCRQCERTCPFGAIAVEGAPRVAPSFRPEPRVPTALVGSREETRPGLSTWDEALAEAARCLSCPDPTCVEGCPAHNDIPAFIAALRSGDLAAAHAALRPTTILPDICSRVCDQSSQCEGACSWRLAGAQPVAIGLLERFVADHAPVPPPTPSRSAPGMRTLRVAIVGAGPAGIAAAWELLEGGAEVELLERASEGLGVLAWGIPPFTLPEAVARRPLDALLAAGATLRTGVDVGRDVAVDDLLAAFDAVILAHGASAPMALRAEGADRPWVEDATSLLRRARVALAQGRGLDDIGDASRVLVVGAGNTAMDVARTLRRLGAQALAVDWMDARFARVRPDELAEARAEGVRVEFSRSVTALREENGRRLAYLARTHQRDARSLPRVVAAPEAIEVDHVVVAMGYRVEDTLSAAAGARLPLRTPEVERTVPPRRLMASGLLAAGTAVSRLVREREAMLRRAERPLRPRLWVVGDALTGPATVVAAMAQGRAAARAVLTERPRRPSPVPDSAAPEGAARGTDAPNPSRAPLGVGSATAAKAAVAAPARRVRRSRVDPLAVTGVCALIVGLTLRLTLVGGSDGWLALVPGPTLIGLALVSAWTRQGVDALMRSSEPRATTDPLVPVGRRG